MHPDLIRAQDKNNSKKNENTVLKVSHIIKEKQQ